MEDISKDILMRAAGVDMEAFEMIYRATSEVVYSIVLRIMNNRDDAKDVTQEVFIKIYKNLNTFRFQSSFKTWVYRISVNTAINACKGALKEADRRNDIISLNQYDSTVTETIVEQSTMTEAVVEQKDKERLVSSLLKNLNPDQRACIVLREIEGLDYKQISEVLKVNINTVRSRLKRARETLLTYKGEVMKNEV